jgi:hypothetical protein
VAGGFFLTARWGERRGKRGQGGPGVRHCMGEKTGKREGGPAAVWDSSVDGIDPRPVGAGGAVAAR